MCCCFQLHSFTLQCCQWILGVCAPGTRWHPEMCPQCCAVTRGQMQFWLWEAARAVCIFHSYLLSQSKGHNLGNTSDVTLDGHSWEPYTYRNRIQSLTLAQLEEAASLFYFLTSHISLWKKRKSLPDLTYLIMKKEEKPQVAPTWFRSDIRNNGRVVRLWNSGKKWIHPSKCSKTL